MPQRGGEIHQISWKQPEFDYLSPTCPDLPGFVMPGPGNSLFPAENVAFSSFYTMFPNAGQAGNYRDYFYDFHGDIRTVEWAYTALENTPETIKILLEATSKHLPLQLKRQLTLQAGSSRLSFYDELVHIGPATGQCSKLPFIYGFHPYHSYPLLEQGTILRVSNRIVTTLPGRDKPFKERFYFESGSQGSIEVYNPHRKSTLTNSYCLFLYKVEFSPFI